MANTKKKANSKARSKTVKAKSNGNKGTSKNINNNVKKNVTTKTVKRANGTTVKKKVNTPVKNNSTSKKQTTTVKKTVTPTPSKKVEVKVTPKETKVVTNEIKKEIPKKEEKKVEVKKPKIQVTKEDEELWKTKTISIKDLPIRPDIKKKTAKKEEKPAEPVKATAASKTKTPAKAKEPIKSLTSAPVKKTKKEKEEPTAPLPTREEVRKAKSKVKETSTKLPTREEVRSKKATTPTRESAKKKKVEATEDENTKLIVTVSPKKEFKAEIKQNTKDEDKDAEKPLKTTKKATTARSNNQTIKGGKKTPKDIKKKDEIIPKEPEKEAAPKKEPETQKVVKKKRKLKVRNLIVLVIFLGSLIMVGVSAVYLIGWEKDNKNTEKITNEILEKAPIEETEDNDNTVVIESNEPKENPYWDYIKQSLISVDFTELKEKNPDTKGWIRVAGTNINYPFVQTTNNEYYLNRSFDKSYNGAGWVFLDYENDINNLNQNTILYAHGRLDTTMFGSLKNIFRTDWYNNIDNHIVKLSTETENTLWQVFSVYITPNTNDYITTSFATDAQYQRFLDTIIGRSQLEFNTNVTTNDKVLTLSTCYNTDDKKVVLHAKLIKKEAR